MKKILATILLICTLVGCCSFAMADEGRNQPEHTVSVFNAKSKGISVDPDSAVSRYKPKIPRGGTLTIWTWYNDSQWYNFVNGKKFNTYQFTYKGYWWKAKVKSGKKWLGFYSGGGIGLSTNLTTKMRTGKIRYWDAYGTIANIVFKQCGVVDIKSLVVSGDKRSVTVNFDGKTKKLKTAYNVIEYKVNGSSVKKKLSKTASSFTLPIDLNNNEYSFQVRPVVKLKKFKEEPACCINNAYIWAEYDENGNMIVHTEIDNASGRYYVYN